MMIVYADILIGVNILINYFLLLLTGKICKTGYRILRILGGSILGGLFSLYIFLPQQNFFIELIIRAFICLLITYISFGFSSLKNFFRISFAFLCVSLLFGGAVLAIFTIFKPNGIVINNGMVYFNISPLILITTTAASYLIINLVHRFTKKDALNEAFLEVEIYYENKIVKALCLIDSGNSLSDNLSDRPVMILNDNKATEILGFSLNSLTVPKNPVKGFRLIPFNSIEHSGVLPAFKTQYIKINNQKIHSVIIAVLNKKLSDDYDGLIGPNIIENLN